MSGILVAYDGSKHAQFALRHAIELAKDLTLPIILLNVQLDIERGNARKFFTHEEIMDYLKEMAGQALRSGIETLQEAGVEFQTEMSIGHPAHEILKVADREEVRFIVMGTRGLGLFSGAVLGSVSYGVLHQASTPVLIVPEQKEQPI